MYVASERSLQVDRQLILGEINIPDQLDSLQVKSFAKDELYCRSVVGTRVELQDYIFNESAYDILRGFYKGLDGKRINDAMCDPEHIDQKYIPTQSMSFQLGTFEMLYAFVKSPEAKPALKAGRKIIALGSLHRLASGTLGVPMYNPRLDPKEPDRIGLVSPLGNWHSPWDLDEVCYLVYDKKPKS